MNHTLRDLAASGADVVCIIRTVTIKEGAWVCWPVFVIDREKQTLQPVRNLCGLCLNGTDEATMANARELWPGAVLDVPNNTVLTTVQ